MAAFRHGFGRRFLTAALLHNLQRWEVPRRTSLVPLALPCFQGKKKHININKFARIVTGLGGWQKFVYVFFFSGSFLMVEKKHINKIPPKIPGQSREFFVYVFCSLCVFFAPNVCTLFDKGGSRRAFRLPGAGGDDFRCAVGPSPCHIRCRI